MKKSLHTIVVVALWLGGGAWARAQEIRLGAHFSPHPLVTEELRARVGDRVVAETEYNKCRGDYLTDEPVLTFTLTEDIPELRVRLEDRKGEAHASGGILVAPDGTYYCDDAQGEVYTKNWKKGRYRLYLFSHSTGVGAVVRFDVPSRSAQEVRDALAKLDTVTISGVHDNPSFVTLEPTASAQGADVHMDCVKPRQYVMPLARLKVDKESEYFIDNRELNLFIVANDHCYNGIDAPSLPVGTHTLWAILPHNKPVPEHIQVEVDDRQRPLAFPDAPVKQVGDLSKPVVVPGKVRAPESWGTRDYMCQRAARQPDVYLESNLPLQHVELSILWGRKPQQINVFGPLDEIDKNSKANCGVTQTDRQPTKYDVFMGKYAVWVGSIDDPRTPATGSEFHILLRRSDVPVDPLTTFAPIPEDLTRGEKAISNHYPFRGRGNMPLLFANVPDRLFVYAVSDINDKRWPAVKAGEPLLVSESDQYGTTYIRYDGDWGVANVKLLTDKRPAHVWLPKKPKVPEVDSLAGARDYAGPEDAAAIAKYDALDRKYQACVGQYLAKHDPTWGHSGELYVRHKNGKIANVSDEVADRGDRKCGGKKLEAAGTKLKKQLEKTRVARYNKQLQKIRERFGL